MAEEKGDDPHSLNLEAARKFIEQSHAERMFVQSGVKDYGLNTIKSVTLLNGGAIVALLAFLAALFGKDAVAQIVLAKAAAQGLVPAFGCFTAGLLCATLASGLGYLNFAFARDTYPEPAELLTYLLGKPLPTVTGWKPAAIDAVAIGAAVLAITGMGAFAAGAWIVMRTLVRVMG